MTDHSYNREFLTTLCVSVLFILFAFSTSFAQAPKTKYRITGYTSQKTGRAELLLYTNQNQFIPYDSTDIKNGIFTFSGMLNEPKSFQLIMGNKGRILFVGNENIIVNARNEKTGEVTVTGSKLTNDYDYYFNRWIAPLINRSQSINQRLNALDATHQREIDSLTGLQGSLFNHIPDSSAAFIRQKPSSFVSLYLLNSYLTSYSTATIAKLFTHLDTSLKGYPSARLVKNKLQSDTQSSVRSPSFSVKDENGQILTPQSFKGNYLLIDFWASWNPASLRDLSFIQKASDRFQHQNFRILTVSLDNDMSAWKNAIEKYQLHDRFNNTCLTEGFASPMALEFGVTSIPRMILIDPDGSLIESNIEGSKLNSRLEKIFTISIEGDNDVALLYSIVSLEK